MSSFPSKSVCKIKRIRDYFHWRYVRLSTIRISLAFIRSLCLRHVVNLQLLRWNIMKAHHLLSRKIRLEIHLREIPIMATVQHKVFSYLIVKHRLFGYSWLIKTLVLWKRKIEFPNILQQMYFRLNNLNLNLHRAISTFRYRSLHQNQTILQQHADIALILSTRLYCVL